MPLCGDLDTQLIKVKLDRIIDNVSCGGQRCKTAETATVGCSLLLSTILCSKTVIPENQGHREGARWQAVIANSWSSDLRLSARMCQCSMSKDHQLSRYNLPQRSLREDRQNKKFLIVALKTIAKPQVKNYKTNQNSFLNITRTKPKKLTTAFLWTFSMCCNEGVLELYLSI